MQCRTKETIYYRWEYSIIQNNAIVEKYSMHFLDSMFAHTIPIGET